MAFTPMKDIPGIGDNLQAHILKVEGISYAEDVLYIMMRKRQQGWSKDEILFVLIARLLPAGSPNRNDLFLQGIDNLFERLEEYTFDHRDSIIGRHLLDPNEATLEENGCFDCHREPQRFFGCGTCICHYCYLERLEARFTTNAHNPEMYPHLVAAPDVVVGCPHCMETGPALPPH